jgi:hypothetical protein
MKFPKRIWIKAHQWSGNPNWAGLAPSEACGKESFSATGTMYAASGVQGSSDLLDLHMWLAKDW